MTLLNVSQNHQPQCQSACHSEAAETQRIRKTRPQYRVRELDTEYVVSVDLPGVVKDAVEISLNEKVLEISATRSWTERGEWQPLAGVSEDGIEYRLRLAVGDEVDGDKITADLDAGVLKLSLSKAEDKKPRRIAVN